MKRIATIAIGVALLGVNSAPAAAQSADVTLSITVPTVLFMGIASGTTNPNDGDQPGTITLTAPTTAEVIAGTRAYADVYTMRFGSNSNGTAVQVDYAMSFTDPGGTAGASVFDPTTDLQYKDDAGVLAYTAFPATGTDLYTGYGRGLNTRTHDFQFLNLMSTEPGTYDLALTYTIHALP